MLRSLLAGFLARGITFPITAIAVLLTTFLTIDYAGASGFAAIALISGLFLLIPFADLGLGAAVINLVAEGGDPKTRNHNVASIFKFLMVPAFLVAVLGTAGATIFSWASVLSVNDYPSREVDFAVMGVFFIFAATIPLSVGQRVLIGLHRNSQSVLLSATASPLALIMTAVLIYFKAPILILSLALSSGLLLCALGTLILAFRLLGMRFSVIRAARLWEVRRHTSVALPMVVVMVGLPIAFQSHRIVLSHLSSVEEIAIYSLGMQFYNPLWSFVSAAAMSLWPYFAKQRALGQSKPQFRRIYLALLGIAMPLSVGLVLAGQPVAELLSKGAILIDRGPLIAFACLMITQAVQQVPGMYLTDAKGMKFQARCVGSMAASSIVLSVVLAPQLGASGPVVATAISVFVFQFIPGAHRLWRL